MQGSMVMTMEKALSPALSDIDLRLVSRILYPGRLIIKCPARTVDIIIMLSLRCLISRVRMVSVMMAINIFSLTISVITILWILSSLSIREEEDEEDVGGPGTWNWESVLLPVANKDETPASSSNRSRPTPVLVYNRVPKCGATTPVSLLRLLAKRNKFHVASARVYNRKYFGSNKEISKEIRKKSKRRY